MWVYNLKGDIQLENGNKDTSVIVFGEKSYCANRLTKDRRALRGVGSKSQWWWLCSEYV